MATREVVRRCVEELADITDETLKASALFEAARDARHPLHGEFVWEAKQAVIRLGIIRARQLIRSVEVELVIGTEQVRAVQFLRDPDQMARSPGYVSISALQRDPQRAEKALIRGLRHAQGTLEGLIPLAKIADFESDVQAILRLCGLLRLNLQTKYRKAG